MAHRTNLIALLGLLASEATAARQDIAGGAPLRLVDALVRSIEDDVERTRQELDELLAAPPQAQAQEKEPTSYETRYDPLDDPLSDPLG